MPINFDGSRDRSAARIGRMTNPSTLTRLDIEVSEIPIALTRDAGRERAPLPLLACLREGDFEKNELLDALIKGVDLAGFGEGVRVVAGTGAG